MKRKKKKLVLVLLLIVVVLYMSILLVDYVNMFKLARKPLFAIEASKSQVATCYDYKFEGLGYNYFTKECYDSESDTFKMKYVKFTLFDKEIRQGVYGLTLKRNI